MKLIIVLIMLTTALLAGCSSGDGRASQLLETAAFEEKQHNFEHAEKLYNEILTAYPRSPSAKDAAQRLSSLKGRKQ